MTTRAAKPLTREELEEWAASVAGTVEKLNKALSPMEPQIIDLPDRVLALLSRAEKAEAERDEARTVAETYGTIAEGLKSQAERCLEQRDEARAKGLHEFEAHQETIGHLDAARVQVGRLKEALQTIEKIGCMQRKEEEEHWCKWDDSVHSCYCPRGIARAALTDIKEGEA